MRPQLQTEFGPKGSCFSTALACILDLDVSEVPNFNTHFEPHANWYRAFRAWVRGRGFDTTSWAYEILLDSSARRAVVPMTPVEYAVSFCRLGGLDTIACGLGPRGYKHATVYRDGELVWDPHPEGGGLVRVEEFHLVLPAAEIAKREVEAAVRRKPPANSLPIG